MHYVWLNRLFPQDNLTTADGRRLQIINPGSLNTGSGPDFFNACVIIDGQTWVGNVELHLRASDWHRHKHTDDPAYSTVILHVVETDDTAIHRTTGGIIPQFVMRCSRELAGNFHSLADFAVETLPCAHAIAQIPGIYLTDWITALGYERLHEKADRISRLVSDMSGDWNEAGFVTVARALGFGTNSDPFERLARATPLRILRRHADDRFIVESILMGQAGLTGRAGHDDGTAARMEREYRFFAAKFGIKAPEGLCWKCTRPQNSPARRIEYLAALICGKGDFISRIMSAGSVAEAYDILNGNTGDERNGKKAMLSRASTDILIINAVIPLSYSFATYNGDYSHARDIAEMLQGIKGESNRITAMFAAAGIDIGSAFVSQAMVQLRREYCEKRKCLYCRIGHRYLSAHALRK